MSLKSAKALINRSGSFALQERRTLRGVAEQLDAGNEAAISAAEGITGGTGTIFKTGVSTSGGIITTTMMIDLTGLASSTTDLDIIGQGTNPAYLGQILAADNGTLFSGWVTCLETPAGGVTDIDLYSATEATGVFDGGIAALVETAILTKGGAWSAAPQTQTALTAIPAANQYLYLTCGTLGTAATYTAGKFLITFLGYAA